MAETSVRTGNQEVDYQRRPDLLRRWSSLPPDSTSGKWFDNILGRRGPNPGVLKDTSTSYWCLFTDAHAYAVPILTSFVPPYAHSRARTLAFAFMWPSPKAALELLLVHPKIL